MDEAYEANLAMQLEHAGASHEEQMAARLAQVEAEAATERERSVQQVIQQAEERCVVRQREHDVSRSYEQTRAT